MNIVRTLGGRLNASGTERINRDGEMEVVKPEDIEVTSIQRINWNSKAKIDNRETYPDNSGDTVNNNKMNVTLKLRTSLPKESEYSTESRLEVSRGNEPYFNKSESDEDTANGLTPGMIVNEQDTRNKKANIEEGNNMEDVMLKSKKENKKSNFNIHDAFCKVSSIIDIDKNLSDKNILDINLENNIPVEEIVILEKIAKNNVDLKKKYILLKNKQMKNKIPGNVTTDTGELEKESDPDICETCKEVGLIE